MIARLLIAGLLAIGGEPAAPLSSATGLYRLVGEQDVASAFMLRPDGSFEYFLSAGGLDERSRGKWSVEGAEVRLDSDPKPVPPSFSQAAAVRSDAPLTVKIAWPNGRGIAGVDLTIGFDSGPVVEDYTQEDGWTLAPDEARAPRWIQLAVPMHDVRSPRFPIDSASANALTFVLTPNDLGVLDFDNLLLERQADHLLWRRQGAALKFQRDQEAPLDPADE